MSIVCVVSSSCLTTMVLEPLTVGLESLHCNASWSTKNLRMAFASSNWAMLRMLWLSMAGAAGWGVGGLLGFCAGVNDDVVTLGDEVAMLGDGVAVISSLMNAPKNERFHQNECNVFVTIRSWKTLDGNDFGQRNCPVVRGDRAFDPSY